MGNVSERLLALRPVTFRYKQGGEDGGKADAVWPDRRGSGRSITLSWWSTTRKGNPETVSYHLLATLLLNEFQKEHRVTQAQATRIAELEQGTARRHGSRRRARSRIHGCHRSIGIRQARALLNQRLVG